MNTGIDMDDEYLTGRICPNCELPTVYEFGTEVCYYCGWSEPDERLEEELKEGRYNESISSM